MSKFDTFTTFLIHNWRLFTKTDIEKYFIAEKAESLVFIILGIAAIVLAIVLFFFVKANWHKGAAIPFLIIGIIHLAASYTVYSRSDKDRQNLVYAYDMNPSLLKTKELPRMEKVNKTFTIIKIAEVSLFLIGLAVFFYFKNDDTNAFWAGIGVALAIEAVLTLGGDMVASKRASLYTDGLKAFIAQQKL